MTKSKALTLLRSGLFNLQYVARKIYRDNAPINSKRMRLAHRIKTESLPDEDVKKFEQLLW